MYRHHDPQVAAPNWEQCLTRVNFCNRIILANSAQDALRQARISIEAARIARGSTTVKHYRTAKTALDKVDDEETDTASLREMIVAFEDLAEVLDQSIDQERVEKCRKRAETLR